MKISFYDELLTVKEGENHRDSHSGCIVERVEDGSGEENLFFHAVLERGIYTKPHFICQLLRIQKRHLQESRLLLPLKFSNVMRKKSCTKRRHDER